MLKNVWFHPGCGRRGQNDPRAAGHQERWQTGKEKFRSQNESNVCLHFVSVNNLADYINVYILSSQDPKRHLEEHVDVLMTSNIVQCLAAMLDTVVFQ